MSVMRGIVFFLFVMMLMVSCTGAQKKKKEAKIQAIIDSLVAERVAIYRKKSWASCREKMLNRASELADSIVRVRAIKTTIIDSLDRPMPPDRPLRPEIRTPLDTTPVEPFFSVDTSQN